MTTIKIDPFFFFDQRNFQISIDRTFLVFHIIKYNHLHRVPANNEKVNPWPDVGIKSSPILPKNGLKNNRIWSYLKSVIFKAAQQEQEWSNLFSIV